MAEEYYETLIERCASCGCKHYVLVVPLDVPEEEEGEVYTHYTLCPESGEELLLQIIP